MLKVKVLTLVTALVIPVAMRPSAAIGESGITQKQKACCLAQKARCDRDCRTRPGATANCPPACAERLTVCYSTGVYRWRNSPSVTCR